MLLHIEAFRHTQCSHTRTFRHRFFSFHTKTLLHTNALYTRAFSPQKLFAQAQTHRGLHTQKAVQQKLLHRRSLHKRFCRQKLLHTDTFTHRNFLNKDALPHTDTFTQSTQRLLSRRFYTDASTQMLFTHRSFDTQHPDTGKSQFSPSFWRSTFISCQRVATGTRKSQAIHFLRSNLVTCERVAPDKRKSHFALVFHDRTSFRAKGLRRTPWNRIFTSVFWRSDLVSCERVAFCAVLLGLPPLPLEEK